MGVNRACGEPDRIKKNTHPKNTTVFFVAGRYATSTIAFAFMVSSFFSNAAVAYASQAVQCHPDGGQFDFVRLPARTPHGGASYV